MHIGFNRILTLRAVILVLGLVHFSGCEPHVVISLDASTPPNFSFSGNGTVPFFVVMEIGEQDSAGRTKYTVLWEIKPDSTKAGTVPLGPITYGKVPTGWTQSVPARGDPPALLEGRGYQAGGPQVEMPEGVVKFKISGGRSVSY